MANQISLFAYLQYGPPTIPILEQGNSQANTSQSYSHTDIKYVGYWSNFNLATIVQEHGDLLSTARIYDDPMPSSVPHSTNWETGFRGLPFAYLYSRVNRSLCCTFQQMAMSSQPLHNVVNFGSGNLAHTTQAYTPDLAFFDHPSQPAATRSDRIPGCLKPSSKWWSDMPKSHRLFDRVQFKQILSEVNRYMAQSNTRIGFILTDKELVPIRKLAEKGHVEIADSIPWDACGQGEDRPQLTVLLALWYLGMLASDDQQLVMG